MGCWISRVLCLEFSFVDSRYPRNVCISPCDSRLPLANILNHLEFCSLLYRVAVPSRHHHFHFSALSSQPCFSHSPAEMFNNCQLINHPIYTMRGLCFVSTGARICRHLTKSALPSRRAARNISYSAYDRPPFSFSSRQQQHEQPSHDGSPSSFLPVPFVTEQLAGAHHSTDLFSRLLKERIVAVYGPVEDRMVREHPSSCLESSAARPSSSSALFTPVSKLLIEYLTGGDGNSLSALPRIRICCSHFYVHQLPWRLRLRGPLNLRHHAIYRRAYPYHRPRPSRQHGLSPRLRRRARQALRPPSRNHHDASA